MHKLFLMCDDLHALVKELKKHHIACDPVQDRGYGLVSALTLPGGGKLGFYQPRHARPKAMLAEPHPENRRQFPPAP